MATERAKRLLEEYGDSHQNTINKRIHWIDIPVIFFVIFGLIRLIPTFEWMDNISPYFNWATLILGLTLLYYLLLDVLLFVGFIFWAILVIYGNEILYHSLGFTKFLWFSIAVFVIAWIAQFIGHKIEGKKPSFLKDLQFLLIGPAWLMNFILKVVK